MSLSLFTEDIVRILANETTFVGVMASSYNAIARRYGAQLEMSAVRLKEAHAYWQEDVTRTLSRGIEAPTEELGHFKHASFIAFWLRRTNPINRLLAENGWLEHRGEQEQARRKHFALFANEVCALGIGFQISLMYEAAAFTAAQEIAERQNLRSMEVRMSRLDYIRRTHFPEDLTREFSKILKHKNMSPYALYMMYRSLFTTCVPSDVF